MRKVIFSISFRSLSNIFQMRTLKPCPMSTHDCSFSVCFRWVSFIESFMVVKFTFFGEHSFSGELLMKTKYKRLRSENDRSLWSINPTYLPVVGVSPALFNVQCCITMFVISVNSLDRADVFGMGIRLCHCIKFSSLRLNLKLILQMAWKYNGTYLNRLRRSIMQFVRIYHRRNLPENWGMHLQMEMLCKPKWGQSNELLTQKASRFLFILIQEPAFPVRE